jgi:N6-adenosine-specific RNA methylase IME4
MDRAADNHYPTREIDQIKALPVAAAAAPNCVLFLWTTVAMLVTTQAAAVATAWGFECKSALFWDKVLTGTGYWARDRVEVLLIATRGDVPAPAPGEQPEQLRSERRGAHSVKPESFAADIERLYPNVPKLEMFARRERDGWKIWGNEAPDP